MGIFKLETEIHWKDVCSYEEEIPSCPINEKNNLHAKTKDPNTKSEAITPEISPGILGDFFQGMAPKSPLIREPISGNKIIQLNKFVCSVISILHQVQFSCTNFF